MCYCWLVKHVFSSLWTESGFPPETRIIDVYSLSDEFDESYKKLTLVVISVVTVQDFSLDNYVVIVYSYFIGWSKLEANVKR